MMIHVESAMPEKKPSTTSYQVAMVFHQQNTSNVMITSVNTFMFSCYWNMEKYIPWYQHQPTQVAKNNSTKILWNFSIQTDHEVINNKPDIIVVDKINKTANLIEVTVSNNCNICNKPLQNVRAYTNLSGDINTLWNLNKVQITPVIVGAMGTFYNKLDDNISNFGLVNHKFRVQKAQKIALLGNAHIIRSFLQTV